MGLKIAAPLRHSWLVFSAETKRLTAYRAQFWFELVLSSIVELLIALAVWRTVFAASGATQIGGYTLEGMMLYLTVAIFFGQATKGTGVGTFQREVYDGSLTKYLIYPLSVYSYKLGTFMPRSLFALGQMLLALAGIWLLGYWPPETSLSFEWMMAGIVCLFFSCLLYFFLIILLESLAFWADNIWALSYALQIAIVFLSGKAVPLELFPSWVRSVLEISPFPFLAYFPAQVFLGTIDYHNFVAGVPVLLGWTVAAYAGSRIIMSRGLHRYTGVGQ
ncbi:MAG: ABC-2 family transporter protein [Deltaproteobacteria bacterium]|nr:ABC-2 family transporter protein [Deltaproteobacteria bacterium]